MRTIAIYTKTLFPPTYRELAPLVDLSLGGLQYRLDKMKEYGLVTWEENKTRTLRLTDAGYANIESAGKAKNRTD